MRIEHPVADYEAWKQAFDADPVHREKSGVRRYRILRAMDDPNYVMIDLEFDTAGEAEALLASLRLIRIGAGHASRTHRRGSSIVETTGVRRLDPVRFVQAPNQRARRLDAKSAFSAAVSTDGATNVPVGWPGVEKKSTSTRATSSSPNSM